MMFRFNNFILVALALSLVAIQGLSPVQAACVETDTSNLPAWVRSLSADGKRYRYYVGQQSASSFNGAFQAALGEILHKIKAEESVEIESVVEVLTQIKARGEKFTETEDLSSFTKATVKGVIKGAHVYKAHVVRTCDGGAHFQVSLMVRRRRSRPDYSVPDPITSGDILWRSAVVPGWGQLHAGHRTRGWFMLSTAVGGLAVGLLTHTLANNDFSKAGLSTRQSDRDYYDERANILQATSYITLALAAGVYVYSVIDASTTAPAVQYYANAPAGSLRLTPTGLTFSF